MTGFGRAEAQDEQHKFTVEIKSVNHRYLDFNDAEKAQLFRQCDPYTVKRVHAERKVDIFISYEDFTQSHMILQYNQGSQPVYGIF